MMSSNKFDQHPSTFYVTFLLYLSKLNSSAILTTLSGISNHLSSSSQTQSNPKSPCIRLSNKRVAEKLTQITNFPGAASRISLACISHSSSSLRYCPRNMLGST
mmetsp:Transcript_25686/g.54257  ORF Transcript_25686/g.54257 Transcript_25686/m.54257 type:complete len:104 (-) Transcript_25686:1839-2150(-)